MVKRRRRSKKWISWLLILILLIAAVVVCYLVWDNYFNDNKPKEDEDSSQVEEEEKTEEEGEPEVEEEVKTSEEDDKKVKQYEGEDPNEQVELSGSVTYAAFLNNNVTIRVNIDQFLDEGNCELNIVKNNEVVYNENARVINSASTSTCEGFDFYSPAVTPGKYGIVIRVTSGEKTGLISGVLEK